MRFSIDYETCEPTLGPASSRGEINTWQYFGLPAEYHIPEMLAWSQVATITNYQGQGFAMDYVKMAIYPNNTLSLFATDVDPVTFKPFYEETAQCGVTSEKSTIKSVRFFTSASAPIKQLTSYDEIVEALKSEKLKIFNNYTSCPIYNGPFGKPGLNIKAGTSLVTTEIFSGGRFTKQPFLAFSEESFIKRYDGKGYQKDLVETKLWQNGTITIRVNVMDAQTFQTAFKEYFECSLDIASGASGIKFFAPVSNEESNTFLY